MQIRLGFLRFRQVNVKVVQIKDFVVLVFSIGLNSKQFSWVIMKYDVIIFRCYFKVEEILIRDNEGQN